MGIVTTTKIALVVNSKLLVASMVGVATVAATLLSIQNVETTESSSVLAKTPQLSVVSNSESPFLAPKKPVDDPTIKRNPWGLPTIVLDPIDNNNVIMQGERCTPLEITGKVNAILAAGGANDVLSGGRPGRDPRVVLAIGQLQRVANWEAGQTFRYRMTDEDLRSLADTGNRSITAEVQALNIRESVERQIQLLPAATNTVNHPIGSAAGRAFDFVGKYTPTLANPNDEIAGVGGLSGLDFDSCTNKWYLISDSKSAPRAYQSTIQMSSNTGTITSMAVDNTMNLGVANTLDGESIRVWNSVNGSKSIFISNEGVVNNIAPSIEERSATGSLIRRFEIPAAMLTVGSAGGFRINSNVKGITLSPSGKKLFAVLETPLQGIDDLGINLTRVLEFNRATGVLVKQIALSRTVTITGGMTSNQAIRATEVLAINDTELLILNNRSESSIPQNIWGPFAEIYHVDTSAAADVSNTSLYYGMPQAINVKPVIRLSTELLYPGKVSVWTAWNTNGEPDANSITRITTPFPTLEGMSWGPQINGKRTLILMSDNAFGAKTETQLWTFKLAQ